MSSEPTVRHLGTIAYRDALARMGEFTDSRDDNTPDEIWCLEHPPVYTLGLNADRTHLVAPGSIEVVQVDRGGQVTYHGPGQLVVYVLLDLRRNQLGIRDLVCALEQSVIDSVRPLGIEAIGRRDAPGVYVDGAKLASVGLRVRRHSSYHGLAVNVDMDLQPFAGINPCGMAGLPVTDLTRLGQKSTPAEFAGVLVPNLLRALASR